MNIEIAIKQLDEQVSQWERSKPGEVDWWKRQAISLGTSMLRKFYDDRITDPTTAFNARADLRKRLMLPEEV